MALMAHHSHDSVTLTLKRQFAKLIEEWHLCILAKKYCNNRLVGSGGGGGGGVGGCWGWWGRPPPGRVALRAALQGTPETRRDAPGLPLRMAKYAMHGH